VFLVASSLSLARTDTIWVHENGQLKTSVSSRRVQAIPLPLINVDELLAHGPLKSVLERLKQFDTKFSSNCYDTAVNAIRLTYGHPRTLSFVLAQIEQAVNDRAPLSEYPTLVRLVRKFALCTWRFIALSLTNAADSSLSSSRKTTTCK